MRVQAVTLLIALSLVLSGCQPTSVDQTIDPQERIKQLEQQLAEAQKDAGAVTPSEQLMSVRTENLQLDVSAISQLLKDALAAAEAGKKDEGQQLLRRAEPLLQFALFELPRPAMAAHLERALALLADAQLMPASKELEEARRLDLEADPPVLGPDLEERLVAIRAKIEKGDPAGAKQDVLTMLPELRGSEHEVLLQRAAESVAAAGAALGREAYTAAQGEMAEAQKALTDLQSKLKGQVTAPAAEKAPAAAPDAAAAAGPEQPSESEAGATSEVPPAKTDE